jgi:hypothetical protein
MLIKRILLNRGYKYRPLSGTGRSSLFALWEVPTQVYVYIALDIVSYLNIIHEIITDLIVTKIELI